MQFTFQWTRWISTSRISKRWRSCLLLWRRRQGFPRRTDPLERGASEGFLLRYARLETTESAHSENCKRTVLARNKSVSGTKSRIERLLVPDNDLVHPFQIAFRARIELGNQARPLTLAVTAIL